MTRGRKSGYTDTFADEVCCKVMTSSKGIRQLCRENPSWPTSETVYEWIARYDYFSVAYTRAKKNQIEVMLDELKDRVLCTTDDILIGPDGKRYTNTAKIMRDRLVADTYKWMAMKLLPRIYGERVTHDVNFDPAKALKELE